MISGLKNNAIDVRLSKPGELDASDIQKWIELQRAAVPLQTPFLHPEFACAVASVRDDVEVAVMLQNEQTVGFFPFQRDRRNIGCRLHTNYRIFRA